MRKWLPVLLALLLCALAGCDAIQDSTASPGVGPAGLSDPSPSEPDSTASPAPAPTAQAPAVDEEALSAFVQAAVQAAYMHASTGFEEGSTPPAAFAWRFVADRWLARAGSASETLSQADAETAYGQLFASGSLPPLPSLASFQGFIDPADGGYALTAPAYGSDQVAFSLSSCTPAYDGAWLVRGTAASTDFRWDAVTAVVYENGEESGFPYALSSLDTGAMPADPPVPQSQTQSGDGVAVVRVQIADVDGGVYSVLPLLYTPYSGGYNLEETGDRQRMTLAEGFSAYVPVLNGEHLAESWEEMERVDGAGFQRFLIDYAQGYGADADAHFIVSIEGTALTGATYFRIP